MQNKQRIYKFKESKEPKTFAEHEIDVITCTIDDVQINCVPTNDYVNLIHCVEEYFSYGKEN